MGSSLDLATPPEFGDASAYFGGVAIQTLLIEGILKVAENLLHEPSIKAEGLFRDISFHLDIPYRHLGLMQLSQYEDSHAMLLLFTCLCLHHYIDRAINQELGIKTANPLLVSDDVMSCN